MGKRNTNKHRKYNLLEHEFANEVCSRCRICPKDAYPSFCFTGQYLDNPRIFTKKVLPKLLECRGALDVKGMLNATQLEEEEYEFILEEAFCANNICGRGRNAGSDCKYYMGCLYELRRQIFSNSSKLVLIDDNRGRKKKRTQKNKTGNQVKAKKVPPTPKFFCNASFRSEVDRIINGNNAEQQDTGERSAGCASADVG